MNILSLTHGPPTVNPPNSLFRRAGFVSGAPPGVLLNSLSKLLIEFSHELSSVPYTLPCQALVPDLVMTFTTEPALRPYSGPKLLVTITYCPTNSVSLKNSPGPPTLL